MHAAVLATGAVAALAPEMRTDDVAGWLFGPGDGYIDAHLYCGLLAEWIEERGGTVRAGTEALGYEGGRLRTSAGELGCDVWSGVYPMSPHGAPVVGPAREDGAIVTVAGAGGSGLQSSPALGALAADWIVHGEPRTIPAARSLAP